MDNSILEAVKVLKEGGLILYPTDTIWGIGCDATNEKAVAKVYALKQREDSKALVMLAADLDMVARYVQEIPQMAIQLVEVNDAPMTIIYPGAQLLAPNVVAEDGSVGIRIPLDTEDNSPASFCRQLVRRLGKPLVSTSANISGEDAPKCFRDISEEIAGSVDYVVPQRLERGASGRASQIIKVGLGSEIEVIRP